MRKIALFVGVALVALASLASMAYAQQSGCSSRENVLSVLVGKYKEQPIFIGLKGELILEVFVNPDTQTYSFVVSSPNGSSCIVESGTGFALIPLGEPI